MSDYGKYKVIGSYNGETITCDFWADYVEYGPLWVLFYQRNAKLFSRDIEIARFRRSAVVVVTKEIK